MIFKGRSAVASAARSMAEARTSRRNSAGDVAESRKLASLLRTKGWVEACTVAKKRLPGFVVAYSKSYNTRMRISQRKNARETSLVEGGRL